MTNEQEMRKAKRFNFDDAKRLHDWALSKGGATSKEWIEFAQLMFDKFPQIYDTAWQLNQEVRAYTTVLNCAIEAIGEEIPYGDIPGAISAIRDQESAKVARLVDKSLALVENAEECEGDNGTVFEIDPMHLWELDDACENLQSEAEAFIREKQAEALEEAAVTHETWHGFDKNGTAAWLREMAADLRNAKKEV